MRAMDIRIADSCFDLRANQITRLENATGVAIVCLRGELWLTQQGDPGDVILGPGECYTLDRDGLALVEALKPSSVCIELPVERRADHEACGASERTSRFGWGAPVVLTPGFAIASP